MSGLSIFGMHARRMAGAVVVTAVCMSAGTPAWPADGRVPQSIEVTAEAIVEVAADLALIDFGVLTRAETAAAASRDNATRMQAVINAVRKVVGDEARLSTGTYAVRPVYAAQREGGAPRVTGYEVSNVVHLRTMALPKVSEAIDAAVKAGANQVQRLVFVLSNDDAPRREALRSAVVKAREETQIIAAALGVKLGPVYSVVEQESGPVRPLARQAFAMSAESASPTPIEPGQIEVRGRVVLTTEIAR
jgi:uncharacterized protein YggE